MGNSNLDKYRKCICILLAISIASLVLTGLIKDRKILLAAETDRLQSQLAGEVFRFHVLADSDSQEDQQRKMQVKEAVIAYMKQEMPESQSARETRDWAESHLEELADISRETLESQGCNDPVTAEVTSDEFPEKTYGDVTFPAGTYETLRIRIGKAQGHNWWCCLYPNLCFEDALHAVVPKEEKEALQGVLAEDEYELVTETPKYKIKWFFLGQ